MFWTKRLKPAHFSSLSVRTGNREEEKSHNEIPREQGSDWVLEGVLGLSFLLFLCHRNAASPILAPCLFPLLPCAHVVAKILGAQSREA